MATGTTCLPSLSIILTDSSGVAYMADKPSFLINNDIYSSNKEDIISGFKIVGEFLEKSILKPNNINFPSSRTELANLIK